MSNTVAERTPASMAVVSEAAKCRALKGGTTAMRKAGEAYLLKFEAESEDSYKARLSQSWLFNAYARTVDEMTGRVFRKNITLGDAPETVSGWVKNINLEGQDLSVFAREVFEDAFDTGVSYIMVDAPRREGVVTQAQAEAQNLRPYFIHLTVDDVLGWQSAVIDNQRVLTQVRISEGLEEQDPADEHSTVEIKQVRVLYRRETGVEVRIYREAEGKWVVHDEYATEMKEITVVPFYAKRSGFFTGKPVLGDLADVNIAHWQSQSDQRNILRYARVPLFHVSGRDGGEPDINLGAGSVFVSENPDAKAGWVEHKGNAIAAGRQDLKDLEFQMEALGVQLLVQRQKTATGAALDADRDTSYLASMAGGLKDVLEQAFAWAVEMAGETGAVTVGVNTDFGAAKMGADEFNALLSSVNTGNMTRSEFLHTIKQGGFIREDADIELIEAELDDTAEGLDLGNG